MPIVSRHIMLKALVLKKHSRSAIRAMPLDVQIMDNSQSNERGALGSIRLLQDFSATTPFFHNTVLPQDFSHKTSLP